MASDAQQFERALERWDELRYMEEYSVPDEVGKIAILASGYRRGSMYGSRKDLAVFQDEADALALAYHARGRSVELAREATADDLRAVLREPLISSVIVIGHGSLSYVYTSKNGRYQESRPTHNNDRDNCFDWRDVSEAADHLKTGRFVQRHCGHTQRELSVPLGAFAVTSHSHVYAAVGADFLPWSLMATQNQDLVSVCGDDRLEYERVKELFPQKRR